MEQIKKILGIDIGILNLGYVYSTLRIDSSELLVTECDRVDITIFKHSKVPFCDCKLHHDYCIPDYIDHFIQEHLEVFEESDLILIERQPPVGITNVQDLIFSRYRNKVLLVSPNVIHKYFKMSKDYSKRKEESQGIAEVYLNNFAKYNNNIRKHDISDALLLIIWYSKKLILENYKEMKNKSIKTPVDLEQFRFLAKK